MHTAHPGYARCRRLILGSFLLSVACLAPGCAWLIETFLPRPAHKKVKAEFDGMAEGDRLLVLAYATEETLFRHPYAPFEVASFTGQEAERRLKVHPVDPVKVARYQEEDLYWASRPLEAIGRQFGARWVLYIELLEFRTREAQSLTLYRGRVRAACSLHDMRKPHDAQKVWGGEVRVLWPENRPVTALDATDDMVRREMLTRLADQLVKKFYDHKVPFE